MARCRRFDSPELQHSPRPRRRNTFTAGDGVLPQSVAYGVSLSKEDGVNTPDDRRPVVRRLGVVSDADLRADFVMAAYDENQRRLTTFAYALTRDADVADDLVQETFLRLIKEHAAGRGPENVTAWLFRVCANLATSRGRRGVVARRFLERRPADETEVAAEVTILRQETSEALVAALAILSDEARTAVVMAAQGFSGREIAEALGRTETSTRTLMFRARERLRTFLVAEGVTR
jgi:RNA polymerase sigma-70 factor (ECF subfamily)